jgi:hypothetical protein
MSVKIFNAVVKNYSTNNKLDSLTGSSPAVSSPSEAALALINKELFIIMPPFSFSPPFKGGGKEGGGKN